MNRKERRALATREEWEAYEEEQDQYRRDYEAEGPHLPDTRPLSERLAPVPGMASVKTGDMTDLSPYLPRPSSPLPVIRRVAARARARRTRTAGKAPTPVSGNEGPPAPPALALHHRSGQPVAALGSP